MSTGTPIGNAGGAGEPVDIATGIFTYQKTDLTLAGRLPVTFTRFYRTQGASSGPFGPGTSHTYHALLLIQSNLRTLLTPDGHRIAFPMQANGTFQNFTDPTYRGTVITATGNNTHSLHFKDGTTWAFNAPLSGTSFGFLTSMTDRNGNTITLTRDSLQNLTAITDSVGRQLTLTINGLNQITQITDPIGRTVQYIYDGNNRLVQVNDPGGGGTFYTYDANSNMLSILDARGITFLTNVYDSNGRVSQQTQADGGVWKFAYTVTSRVVTQTVVTDPRGNVTTSRINGKGYTLGQTDSQGQPTISTRDPATNLLLATTDALGRKTSFTYDAAGNTTSITDPNSKTTSFTYEPMFSRVTS